MALFAEMVELIEAGWTVLHTQSGAQQLQQRRAAGLAGLGSRTSAHFTGTVAFLTAGALPVVPGGAKE